MSLILNIHTATEVASVCLAKESDLLDLAINENYKNDAGWLHNKIDTLLKKNNCTVNDLSAVAVSIGPGSYTGLRVGLASAKGFCYALNIPLIGISTLQMLAFAVQKEATGSELICPMIDARRMEVYTALYDKVLVEKMTPQAMIVNHESFAELLTSNSIIFCGSGSKKFESLISTPNAQFSPTVAHASHLSSLANECFRKKQFSNLAYTEPLYIKEFHSSSTRLSS